MAWVEFHGTRIKRLKKFSDMRRQLNWSANEALGFLGSFWGEVIELAEDGDISKWSPEYLCDLTGITLNPERVWETLVRTGWIDITEDGLFLIHDWLKTAGRYLELKYKNYPETLSVINKKHAQKRVELIKGDLGNTTAVPPDLTLPNQPDQPNLTKPNLDDIVAQNRVLLTFFNPILQDKINVYMDRVSKKNKSKVITEGRKNTLLNELINAKSLCNNDNIFGQAVDASIDRDACCIGYVNAVIKNKKTQKPR